jgi:hypothetical protein
MQQYFRIRLRGEAMARRSQFLPQLTIVVYLAVEHQRQGSARVRTRRPQHHGLTSRGRKIDDGEAPVPETGSRLFRHIDPHRALPVGPAMRHTIGHPLEQAGGKVALHSDDAAHLAGSSGD